jgi:hypothetical protein
LVFVLQLRLEASFSLHPLIQHSEKKKVALLLVTDLSGLEGKKQVPGFMAIALYHLFKGNPYQRK